MHMFNIKCLHVVMAIMYRNSKVMNQFSLHLCAFFQPFPESCAKQTFYYLLVLCLFFFKTGIVDKDNDILSHSYFNTFDLSLQGPKLFSTAAARSTKYHKIKESLRRTREAAAVERGICIH